MGRTIGFIGAGKIVDIMLGALCPAFGDDELWVWNRTASRSEALAARYPVSVSPSVKDLAERSDWLFVAVKPYAVAKVLSEACLSVRDDALVISMAAGVTIDAIKTHFAAPPAIVRIMPNLPLKAGCGMTAICPDPSVKQADIDALLALFSSVGRARLVEERLFDTVTALSGSGPAFAFLFIESMADGAVLNGMDRAQAYEFAAQTVMGAAKIILESDRHPGELKDIVASPAGTTMAGIHSLERKAFRAIVMDAVDAAAARSRELSS
ncbi:MAG TPA: pyrroline-5-carboxylate reductase [Spirochaetales bacterium]|nr:pyrroline-5-carboxylate reductase [Spirochaetales bacterium]